MKGKIFGHATPPDWISGTFLILRTLIPMRTLVNMPFPVGMGRPGFSRHGQKPVSVSGLNEGAVMLPPGRQLLRPVQRSKRVGREGNQGAYFQEAQQTSSIRAY